LYWDARTNNILARFAGAAGMAQIAADVEQIDIFRIPLCRVF
jgi:hypothetical protein